MRKIKNKFFVIFLLVGLVPLLAMGIVAIFSVSKTHRSDVSALEMQLLQHKRGEIQKFIDDTVGTFQLQVGYEQTGEIKEKDQDFLLNSLLGANKNLTEASFINLDGQETKKIFRDIEDSSAVELLNVSGLEKFTAPKKGRDYIGSAYYTEQGPMISLASPVKNKNGEIIMVLRGEMNLAPLEQIAQSAHLGNRGYFYIVDQNGDLLAHSQADRFTLRRNLAFSPFVSSVVRGEQRTGLEDSDRFQSVWNEDVIAAGIHFEKTGWGFIVEWPAEDAFAVIRTINMQLYGTTLFAFVIIMLLTFWVSHKIAKPIQVLTEGATFIGKGYFDHRILIKTQDELEDLGTSFNTMAKDLATIQELREQAIRAESLQKSLEKERELSHSKDEFIRNASHQLRTPLASILWSLESAVPDATKLSEDLGKSLKGAYDGTQNLNEILNDLLSVSEFGLGYTENKLEPTDLDALIKEVSETFATAFKKKNIAVSYRQIGAPSKAKGNATVFKKALAYLFDNETIYANATLEVSLKEENNEIVVAFKDDGIGIPEDDKPLIFTQFFRAKNAIVKKNVGTGLGLFIVKNIITGLGGRVWFESTENKGSSFFVALPKAV